MLFPVFYILASLVLFYFGASWLIKSISSLALKAGVSPLVARLTLVILGTSSPILFVSFTAAVSGHGNIVIGTVVGSNLFNIGMILGISALVAPLKIRLKLLKTNISLLIIATIEFMILFSDRNISRSEGAILLSGMALYTLLNIILTRKETNKEILPVFDNSIKPEQVKWYFSTGMMALGIASLFAGSEFLLRGAVDIARALGVGETIIGLTILSACSSMPLLVSSLIAAIRKEHDILIGNVIGSNIFNILCITGISAMITPLSTLAISNVDLYVMLGASLLLLPFWRTNYILKRDEGLFIIGLYLIYMYYLWPR